ncbi:Oxoglutarate and iron-dependent oxygenase degradation C-term-domain-containing protein [Paraphysoderma sedebokerense]|nr:Oxoglutarate and iron-dependent oxygenase degradation C-term-domain-containing protein [Paraphysoderma sedebokerense]
MPNTKRSLEASSSHVGLKSPAKKAKIAPSSPASASLINPRYLSTAFQSSFHRHFTNRIPYTDCESSSISVSHPFQAGHLFDILDPAFLRSVKAELLSLPFTLKQNDLYNFYQTTQDLASIEQPFIKQLRETIYSDEFVGLLSSITGLKLDKSRVDLSGHRYPPGGYLLCHDDDIQDTEKKIGRRIAFIIYLVDESWSKDDGGRLDLYSCDDSLNPSKIETSLYPQFNSLAFFPVTSTSYHQVSENLNPKIDRISISGWFHGPIEETPILKRFFTPQNLPSYTSPELKDPIKLDLDDIAALKPFINSSYLNPKMLLSLSSHFIDTSSITLQDFLRSDFYDAVSKEFANPLTKFTPNLGPPHSQSFQLIASIPPTLSSSESSPSLIKELYNLLSSPPFLRLLSSITNLSFSMLRSSIRRFIPGNYTLIHDHFKEPLGLDFTLYVFPPSPSNHSPEWDEEFGGGMYYLAEGIDEVLCSVIPKENALCLVLRDEGVRRFVRYISACRQERDEEEKSRREFNVVWGVYEESKDDDDAKEEGN